METPQESIRRVEDPLRRFEEDVTKIWPYDLFASTGVSGTLLAGRMMLFETLISTPSEAAGSVDAKRVLQQFKFFKYMLSVWVKTKSGEDSQGPYEEGFYRYFVAYIPLPWTSSETGQSGLEAMKTWMLGVLESEAGVHYVPVSGPAHRKLSEDWSEPVEVKIEGGEMLFRALDRDAMLEAMGLRHPQVGEEIEQGPPWVKTWVSD